MGPFLAMIIPVGNGGSGPVDPGYGVPAPPTQIWGGKPGPWGGSWVPPQPGIWPGPGYPAHPIAPGGPPPGTWGGSGQPFPTPPIVIPPNKPGDPPHLIWGGSNEPFPTPPIELPGLPQPPDGGGGPPQKLVTWKTVWTPSMGWVVIGVPNVPHPAPAA